MLHLHTSTALALLWLFIAESCRCDGDQEFPTQLHYSMQLLVYDSVDNIILLYYLVNSCVNRYINATLSLMKKI